MRDFETHLLGASLLLVATTGCRQPAPPSEGKRADGTVSDTAAHLATAPPAQTFDPSAPVGDAELPTPEQRTACLGPPLSPRPEQLPEVEGLRHFVEGQHHLFLPTSSRQLPLGGGDIDNVAHRIGQHVGTAAIASIGSCGTPRSAGKLTCLRLTVQICQPWLEDVRRLAPVVRAEGLGILVEIAGRTVPRCAAGDRDCGPLPYHAPRTDASRDDHEWAGDFTLPLRPGGGHRTLRDDLSAGRCTHAGDCVRAGCGNHCEAWYHPVHGANCPGFGELADAYCGCVEGRCAWFTQPETAQLRARAKVEGWQGGIPQQEAPQPRSADELFERRLSDAWMLRQMRRLAPSWSLPKEIEFHFTWHPRTRVTALTLTADGQPAAPWLVGLFEHLRLPEPETRPFRPVRVLGTLRIEDP